MDYQTLSCRCGGQEFGVAGVPRYAVGSGGHFVRTLRRAWQEARRSDREEDALGWPFEWPLRLRCESCGGEADFDLPSRRPVRPGKGEQGGQGARVAPRENYRCRACRRGTMTLCVGIQADPPTDRKAVVVVAGCCACSREAILSGRDDRPSEQEIKLDHLYGRR
jgi:hypothetical protein